VSEPRATALPQSRRVQHVVAPLDPDHRRVAQALAGEALEAAGASGCPPLRPPHLTLVSYEGLAPAAAVAAVRTVAAAAAPIVVRAHGYGIFAGDVPSELCLFVPVVRDADLDGLQRRLRTALEAAGATVDGQSRPAVWTPHVTLLDRCLDPSRLAHAMERLAQRPHPSWNVLLDRIEIRGTALPFGGTPLHS
jgi:2'-5' RNA ligase